MRVQVTNKQFKGSLLVGILLAMKRVSLSLWEALALELTLAVLQPHTVAAAKGAHEYCVNKSFRYQILRLFVPAWVKELCGAFAAHRKRC